MYLKQFYHICKSPVTVIQFFPPNSSKLDPNSGVTIESITASITVGTSKTSQYYSVTLNAIVAATSLTSPPAPFKLQLYGTLFVPFALSRNIDQEAGA